MPLPPGVPATIHSLLATLLVAALAVGQEPTPRELPGPRPDGSVLLPSGWGLMPHGAQIALPSDLAVRSALHPAGRWLAVQHCGYREHVVALVDLAAEPPAVVAQEPLGKSWSGLCWSPDGQRLFVSGGVDDQVLRFDLTDSNLVAREPFGLGDPQRLDLVAGLAPAADGGLWVCLQQTSRLLRLDAAGGTLVECGFAVDAAPYECLVSADGSEVFVSLWGRGHVAVVEIASGRVRRTITTGPHPCALAISTDGARLFVSNANENTVTVIETRTGRVTETIATALHPFAPPGSTPNALALSPDGATLLVANADNNDLAVFDVRDRATARALGFVPVGQYPTAVSFFDAGRRVVVANGKGSTGSRANPKGPQPEKGHRHAPLDYSGALFGSSLAVFPVPDARELARLSRIVHELSPLDAGMRARGLDGRPADSPIPARVGDPSPIRHVVYVIKENRTYDQVFGDLPQGNGEPSLCLFPREVTPNHHAIAEQFVLLDNFYVESEVSADGHEWTMGAYATDFVERTWPVTYGGKGGSKQADGRVRSLAYPSEGKFAIAVPKNGYLFDLAHESGVSFRSYGEFVQWTGSGTNVAAPVMDVLKGNFDPEFHGWDLDYSDVDRAERFLVELGEFEAKGTYPSLVVLRLPNDHTNGTSVGSKTPRAYLAENDLALGKVLEGLSRSRFWPVMAVFVVEDDAQNGPDHVDAHRTVALVAGGFVKRGAVVSTMYSTSSMLRTMELILGMPPMSQFDAAARPMWDCFSATADARPYAALAARYDIEERNTKTAWGARMSERFDFSTEDAADDLLLNEVVWRSVKGADSPMPAPRRAAFVRALDDD